MSFNSLKIGKYVIEKPIVQGGMGVGISWDQLAGTVSKEGGLGVISSVGTGYYNNKEFAGKLVSGRPLGEANFYSKDGFEAIIKNAREICGDKPLAANILYAINGYGDVVRNACELGIDIIITGAGLPTNMPEFTEGYPDVALVPIVSSAKALKIICKRWKKRYNRVPDAVVVEGPKSGGHQGFTYEQCKLPENQLENIVAPVVEEAALWGDIPVIAAGGVWDKSDIEDMMSRGARAVQMGTRFIGTHECDAHENLKNVLLNAKEDDIKLMGSPVGYPAQGVVTNVNGESIEGALVSVGTAQATTDASGYYTLVADPGIQDVVVHADSYIDYTGSIEVIPNDTVELNVELDIILWAPINLTYEYVDPNVILHWEEPVGPAATEFRYDDGTATAQLGFGDNEAAVLGGAHFYNAVIEEVTWMLTSNAPHPEAKILIFGLILLLFWLFCFIFGGFLITFSYLPVSER